MSETPDTWMYYRLHDAMRSSSDRLVAASTDLADGDVRRAAALATWFDGFVGELRHHHMAEDDVFFPALADRVASYEGDHSEQLAADHAHLEDLLDELATAFHALADGRPWGWHQPEAVTLSTQLRDHLYEHLSLEDSEVIPLFERHFTAEEYDALDQRVIKTLTFTGACFTCPWLMDNLDDEGKARVMTTAPLPLKLIWRATRRGYARRVAAAFGTAVATQKVPQPV